MLLVKAKQTYVPRKLQVMTRKIIRIIARKWVVNVKFFCRRKSVFLVPPLVVLLLMLWPSFWWFTRDITRILLPPAPKQTLRPVVMNRSLEHYIEHCNILVEPTHPPCKNPNDIPVIIMVASAPPSTAQRQAIRETWARYQPTYFALGVYYEDKGLLDITYKEAKIEGDIIVFGFQDHYQNQTLKTALMMKWGREQCPTAQFLFITLDDVMVNPWTLNKLLWENIDAQLIGYILNDTDIREYTYNKWYIPEVLREEGVPQYLSGTGYLIRANYINQILKKAYEVPIVNLEDIYFTYLIAHKELGLNLRHDRRLSPYKPWLNIGCVYWGLASTYRFGPTEMIAAWTKIENLVINHDDVDSVCKYFNFHTFNDLILY